MVVTRMKSRTAKSKASDWPRVIQLLTAPEESNWTASRSGILSHSSRWTAANSGSESHGRKVNSRSVELFMCLTAFR